MSVARDAVTAPLAAAFLLTLGTWPALARGQAAPPSDQPPLAASSSIPTNSLNDQSSTAQQSSVVKMSPFEVQTSDKDIGYYAQNTLAGSRMNSKLDDLGASITVVTKQQMEDTSAIDINDIFLYEASTEGTENYTALGGTSKGTGVGDQIQTSPQTSTRLRGLGAPDITRDYFTTNSAIQVDTYNIDRIEISRGPNSTLFGIGSPSGVVNETIEEAVLNKDSNEISGRYGSFGDERASFNLNRALITDKLAIAVAGLYQNTHRTDQEPAYDLQRREFAALTLKPFPKTTVQADVEFYDNPNRRPNSITPVDEVTPWIQAGRPVWDPITYTATVNGTTTAPIPNQWNAGGINMPQGLVLNEGNFGLEDPAFYLNHGQVQLWEQETLGTNLNAPGTPTTPVGAFGPIGNEVEAQSGGNYLKFASNAPAGQTTYPLFKEPGITNTQLLNYQGVNTLAMNFGEDKAQTYHVEIQQEIIPNLFVDAGWYREMFQSQQHNYLGQNAGNAVMVDPNVRLLNGAPNPFFGRPYIVLQQPGDVYLNDLNEQERLAIGYNLDFTHYNGWIKWLGHHNILGFYQHRENDIYQMQYRQEVLDAHSWSTTTDVANAANTSAQGGQNYKIYLSDAGNAISYGPSEFQNSAFTYPLTWYNAALNGGTWTNENAKIGPAFSYGNKTQQQIWSYSGGLQDYFFNDRLVLTLGQRHDYNRTRTTASLPIDPTTGVDDPDNLANFGSWNQQSGITRQAGAVLHIFKWLSVHYNQSDNFNPANLGEDAFGNILPSPSGHGKDYGFSVSLLGDKLVAELNWYKSDVSNSREGTTTYISRATRIDYSQFIPWAQEVATNALGPSATGSAINAYAQANVLHLSTGFDSFINGQAHLSDTQTVIAHGQEFNLTYNPEPNWTMKFTAAQDVAVDSSVFPHVQQYLASRLPVWENATDSKLGPFWTTANAGGINGLGGESPVGWLDAFVYAGGLDIELAQQNHIQPDLSRYHFNYLTNYLFVSGPLKNFGIGGALRYETPAAIGYYGAAPDPNAGGAIDSLQPFNPINGKEVIHQDMWLSYATHIPLFDRRIRTKFQLNVRDLYSGGYLLVVGVNPDGSPANYRLVPPRQLYFTTTFDF